MATKVVEVSVANFHYFSIRDGVCCRVHCCAFYSIPSWPKLGEFLGLGAGEEGGEGMGECESNSCAGRGRGCLSQRKGISLYKNHFPLLSSP